MVQRHYTKNNMIDHYLFHYRFKREKYAENLLNF